MQNIIFTLDSRGKNIEKYVQKNTASKFIARGVQQLRTSNISQNPETEGLNLSQTQPFQGFVLAAAICNLSKKINHSGGTQIIYELGNSQTR